MSVEDVAVISVRPDLMATHPAMRERHDKVDAPKRRHTPPRSDDSARVHDDGHDVESTPFRDGFLFGMQPAPAGALVPGIPRKAVLSGWACHILPATS